MMDIETLRLETREGDRMLWIPEEAGGDANHATCLEGVITRFDGKRVMMKFDADVVAIGWDAAQEVAIDPRTLRIL